MQLLREAAQLYQSCGELIPAADALEQARASAPEDLELAADARRSCTRPAATRRRRWWTQPCWPGTRLSKRSFAREQARRQRAGDRRGEAALLQSRALAEPSAASVARFLAAADLYREAGDPEASKRCVLWAFERDPSSPAAFERAVQCFEGAPEASALADILARRAMAVEADAPELHLRRAQILASSGDRDGAVAAADEVLALEGPSSSHVAALILRPISKRSAAVPPRRPGSTSG